MSFEKVECEVLRCDGPCRKLFEWDYTIHFSEIHGGRKMADDYISEGSWEATEDGKHYCPECVSYDEDGNAQPIAARRDEGADKP